MQIAKPDRVVDPVCGMSVDVARAEEAGLTVEHEGRTYAFCRAGCRRAFLEEPEVYVAKAESAAAHAEAHAEGHGHGSTAAVAAGGAATATLPVIDEGMRRWYESCSCCLSDVYPEVKAALDAERAAKAAPAAGPGICEVAGG